MARIHRDADSDRGLTLIEVVIALMVFSVVAVGVAYSLTSILTITKDGRSRAVAANLAAQEIDSSRSVENIFNVLDKVDVPYVIDGTTYYLTRRTGWVTSTNTDAQCGAAGTTSGGSLEFKRVNVTVTWEGMRPGTTKVRSDTLLSPNSRINDPALGTILVSVLTAAGTGSAGITVTAKPTVMTGNTAQPITDAPLPTDAQGCSYVLKVVPGTYDVKISKTGYADVDQNLSSVTKTVVVAPGLSASAGFQFDLAGQFTANYAANYVGTKLIPTNIDLTYTNTYGDYRTVGNPAKLHPFTSGYQAIAGYLQAPQDGSLGCLSPDPASWNTPDVDGAIGQRSAPVTAAPGESVTVDVPMGIVTVTGAGGKYLTAVSQPAAAGTGDPGCEKTMTYTFNQLSGSSSTIALPFGSWMLYTGSSLGSKSSTVSGSAVTVVTRGVVTSNVVTLDPRVVLP